MANKNNIRSIRFSDEMAELIDQQIGDTFTAKFESLITKCVWELPAKERELKLIQELIDQEEKRLQRIRKYREEMERASNALSTNVLRANNLINEGIRIIQTLIEGT